jgi:enoyl-CoA hydratase/carnithine racemase
MSDSHILVDQAEGILTITFNRPEKKNAFTIAMYEACVHAMRKAEADPTVRVILFTGAGAAFTSGNDLFDFMNAPPTGEDSPVLQFLWALLKAKKPLVAAVNGLAIGIGTTMLLHCDLVYAADTAKFTMPFVSLGLVPEGGSSYLIPRLAGHAKASELLLLGESFTAKTAEEIGVVTSTAAGAELMEYARAKCAALAAKAPEAVRQSKELLRAPIRAQLEQVMRDEVVVFGARLGSDEAREAFTAFFEKRKPDFSTFS